MTDYNNKTYRINDIDFTSNPKKTFKCKEKDVSFIDYYYEVSQLFCFTKTDRIFSTYLLIDRFLSCVLTLSIKRRYDPSCRLELVGSDSKIFFSVLALVVFGLHTHLDTVHKVCS